MNKLVPPLLCLLATALLPALRAQSKPEQTAPGPTFTARTELVLVPAVVTDHHGAHIPGLSKDDFVLLENGAEQKVASFEEVKPSSAPVRRLNAPTAPLEFTNLRPPDFQPRRINIIVLDTLNTSFSDQAYARQQLIHYLSTYIQPDDLTTLLVFSRTGIKVIHDFTTDTAVLIAALKRQKGRAALTEGVDMGVIATDPLGAGNLDQQQIQTEADRLNAIGEHADALAARYDLEYAIHATIDCMEDIARAYAGIPGRKALIWVTGSFPMMLDRPNDPFVSAYQQRRDRMLEDLNSANIAVYPVDARGLVPDNLSASQSIPRSVLRGGGPAMANMQRSAALTLQDSLATLSDVAERTGGRAYFNSNDLVHAFENASADSSAYYLLGYYIKRGEGKPGWRKLTVKVKRPGVQVRARSGYFFTRDAQLPDEQRKQEITAALVSPFESTALPMLIRWTGQSAADQAGKADRVVDFLLYLDPRTITVDEADGNQMSLDFVAVATTPELKNAATISQDFRAHLKPDSLARLRSTGITYHNQLKLPAGEYSVKFVVRDNLDGRVGSVTAPLKVQ